MIEEKRLFFEKLKSQYPRMKVMYLDKINNKKWDKEKILEELTKEELEEVNLIKQLPDEIILDVENKFRLIEIKEKLKAKRWGYIIYETGSRGYHFVIRFSNIEELKEEVKEKVRKHIIREFGTDEAVAKSKQWISAPFCHHFKTGNTKTILEKALPEVNIVPTDVIEFCLKDITIQSESISLVDENFKDWYKTDPYLKFILTNKILEGERNNVLFKNFAVAIVKSGLSKEDTEKLITAIVNNCPGKTNAEFMGWIEKVQVGEITEYNKAEIVSWAARYNYPILYDLFKDVNIEKLYNLKELWNALWNYRIVCQDTWRELCFYNLLSTILNEKVDDLRIHPVISSDSGTGKDEGMNLVREILEELGVKTFKPSSVTDRTLIGSVNQMQLEINTKYGLSKDIPEIKGKEWKDPREPGMLAMYDWIGFGESESIFKPDIHNKKVQLILRQAMDKSRRIERGVSGEALDLNTNTTFSFATYPMSDIIEKLLTNGLFQRVLYFNKKLEENEHKKILQHINMMKFDNTWRTNFHEKEYVTLICDKLKEIKIWYEENRNKIKFFSSCEEFVNNLWNQYELEYDVLLPADKSILNSIIRRAATNLYKLIFLSVIYKKKEIVELKDVEESFKLIKECLNSIRNLMVTINSEKKFILGLLYILKDESKNTMAVHNEMREKLGILSTNKSSQLIRRCKDAEYVTEFKNGKFTFLSLTEKGRDMIV